ncbi:MAG: hypothetical protein KIS67_22490 [Verrucomicrobiae bacterium]|nr:hypothetical protein [Verrucomicrobiae bacterium]
MKKLIALTFGCALVLNTALAAEPSEADQKWLTVVEKKVTDGESRISTPSLDRVNLLKKWAAKKNYSVEVTKTDAGYRIELSKRVASK